MLRAPLHAAHAAALAVSDGRAPVYLAAQVDGIVTSVICDSPSLAGEVAEAVWAIAWSCMKFDAGLSAAPSKVAPLANNAMARAAAVRLFGKLVRPHLRTRGGSGLTTRSRRA